MLAHGKEKELLLPLPQIDPKRQTLRLN
jgi:hypothetical protein